MNNKFLLILLLLEILIFSSCFHEKKPARKVDFKSVSHNLISHNNNDITKTNARDIYEEGLKNIEKENYEKAKACFYEADFLFPNSPNILTSLGGTMMMLEKKDSAIFFLKKAIILDSNYTRAYLGYGLLLNAIQKQQEAINIYEDGLKTIPLSKRDRACLFYNLACVYNDLKEYPSALNALDSANEVFINEKISGEITDFKSEIQNYIEKK